MLWYKHATLLKFALSFFGQSVLQTSETVDLLKNLIAEGGCCKYYIKYHILTRGFSDPIILDLSLIYPLLCIETFVKYSCLSTVMKVDIDLLILLMDNTFLC